jgi:hypothetical protein
MKFAYFSLAAILAALVLGVNLTVPAAAETEPHASAVKACTTASAAQPAAVVAAVDDGRGGSLLWLTDADANLWLCNADAEGKVFALTQMTGDLLEGAGAHLIDIKVGSEGEIEPPGQSPITIAERACQLYLENEGKVIGSGSDGLGGDWVSGFYVFIETENGLFLCDATGDAQVWAFAEIGDPLSLGNSVG